MTSASSSEPPGRRNLAVYQVPPPPSGWEGQDLVRIVDALGIGAAWLDARRLGSVVALHLRADVNDPWTSFSREDGGAIVVVTYGEARSAMRQRDPVAASFSFDDGELLSHFSFQDGALTIETTLAVSFLAYLAAKLAIDETSTDGISSYRISLLTNVRSPEGGQVSNASR